jgi:hypothetical protein
LDDQEKKKDYIKGATQIEQHCEQRGIEKLYHFTPLENVESILDSGICARAELENREDAPIFPDPQRLDGLPYWISASISFPNYKMFYSYRCRLKTKVASWAIICLDVSVLWKLKCRYYPSNAARNYDQDVLLDDLSSPEAFERLFLPHLSWSSNCTTDPQAEVMIHKHIPKTYFKNVIVENNKSKTIISSKSVPLPISVDPSLFKPREDYENWR